MDRLTLALTAGLPLVQAETADTLNFPAVVKTLVGKAPTHLDLTKDKDYAKKLETATAGTVFWWCASKDHYFGERSLNRLYQALMGVECTLVVLNLKGEQPQFFQAGTVPVPRKLVRRFMLEQWGPEKTAELLPSVSGLTVKAVGEVLRMTLVGEGELTPHAVQRTRQQCYGTVPGVESVSTDYGFYVPDPALQTWVGQEGHFFLEGEDERLRPRGLLMGGPPGTGKTMGAKYIARSWDVPLYRLDVGGLRQKYVGESEKRLRGALQFVEHEAPCVMLVDEVEKVMGNHDGDSGVAMQMLGGMLWWLAEHRSRVLTVMTTNDPQRIPPELHRAGRIDHELHLGLLNKAQATDFARACFAQFGVELSDGGEATSALQDNLFGRSLVEEFSHAEVDKLVRDEVKQMTLADVAEG